MGNVCWILGALALAFVIWRVLTVPLGMRNRDRALLEELQPLVERLKAGGAIEPGELERYGERAQIRPLLYWLVKEHGRLGAWPRPLSTEEAQAEGLLAHWLMHPNEAGAAPERIEPVTSRSRTVEGQRETFHVLRYRMPEGHWAGADGWILGVAGPFRPGDEPYAGNATAFSVMTHREADTDINELLPPEEFDPS